MVTLNLSVVIKNPRNDAEFLLVLQERPREFGEEEYDSYVDSDLWDLPFTRLKPLEGENRRRYTVSVAESCSDEVDLGNFDLESALNRVLAKLGFDFSDVGEWRFFKRVKEPEFGPDSCLHTCFLTGKLLNSDRTLQEHCKWMSMEACLEYLVDVKPGSDRVGPLVFLGLEDDSVLSMKLKKSPSLPLQEYPPGVMLVPMHSRTQKPFKTTNLIVIAPENDRGDIQGTDFVASGDALIVDPGCHYQLHEELKSIVAALPRKLIVFVTHHHPDHIDGLSAVQESNPDAILLAHVKTRDRIGPDCWSRGYTPVSGGEDIYVNGQILRVIFAPGHTDGHMALLHLSTHSLIVGDHCVGQGSAALDITSGGNMTEYFQSTYKFLELSPHVLIPMHGRINLWPKHMLCEYLKNRRSREESILKAIEGGARTLFDIVARVYAGVDRKLWLPAASNVRLHIDHLARENRLPEGFKGTCGLRFVVRWGLECVGSQMGKAGFAKLLVAGAIALGSVLYLDKRKKNSL
ncbi:PREDICTED: uncharacterized protein LOC104821921 isoform X2 [Tarenaya hassleriana]|uniref:uncharacterized protein LOC104821921 isoform X2 n=1 Tax=Tarenaya hassleriana TaxID=28532 RepID=UPI00053CA7B1|nr:PREDICTED: uncharacterized protein LOC104821921 isoform X2 [Tarenaya hassleriana]